jgi:hypothetical protein
MNARGVSSEALAKDRASADSAEEMKDTTGLTCGVFIDYDQYGKLKK